MAYSNIDKPNQYFNTVLYTGNGSTQSITGVGFQPDLVWIKDRSSGALWHFLFDAIRGATERLVPNEINAEATSATSLTAFDSDGFSLGDAVNVNTNTDNFVSWSWLGANGTSSNTDGSITSSVSANTTSGFSIVSYTGNLTDGATVGHGLGVTPSMIIFKNRSDVQYWVVYHKDLGGGNAHLRLDDTSATNTSLNMFSSTAPTSSVFELGNKEQVNGSGNNIIAYCFAEKKGFSKFGTYIGNGSTDGPFVYTGFKPAFVLKKPSSRTGGWQIEDNKRNTFNVVNNTITADTSNAEDTSTAYDIDILSNGFKLRATNTHSNESGSTYIYMAFAESPLVGSNLVPNNAR